MKPFIDLFIDKKGHKMIAENTFFIEKFLFKRGTDRKMTDQE